MKKSGEKTDGSTGRVRSEIRVYYGPSQVTILSGLSSDISTGGLFLSTIYPLELNETLKLVFSFPEHLHEKAVSCDAKVTWINDKHQPCKPELPPGVGLKFLDLPAEHSAIISNFIDNCQPGAS